MGRCRGFTGRVRVEELKDGNRLRGNDVGRGLLCCRLVFGRWSLVNRVGNRVTHPTDYAFGEIQFCYVSYGQFLFGENGAKHRTLRCFV